VADIAIQRNHHTTDAVKAEALIDVTLPAVYTLMTWNCLAGT